MTVENFEKVLNLFLNRRPFTVFTIELNGGQRFEVDSPNAVAFRKGIAMFVAPGGIPALFDHESVNTIFIAPANTDLTAA